MAETHLYSKSFIQTLREDPKNAECTSHKLLLKAGFLSMVISGVYSYLPLGLRVLNSISAIIRKHMNASGAQEVLLSALQPIEVWQKTGRDVTLAEVMIRFTDRKNRALCLGPTHEEMITEIGKRGMASYRHFPFTLYQIQTKFRDETRPRFGLIRSCEFIMKDAYSFDIDESGLDASYQKMLHAYRAIFSECGLTYVMMEAESGAMGGTVSHEFLIPSPIGEDTVYRCASCNTWSRQPAVCACKKPLTEQRMIEVGHIFKLGTKYTQAQDALFLDKNGTRHPAQMGCYGIGVSRLLPAIIEQCFDDKGIMWPRAIAPYGLTLVVLDEKYLGAAIECAHMLNNIGVDVLIDDRNDNAGVKFNDAYLLGNPYIGIMGKNFGETGNIDIEDRATRQKKTLTPQALLQLFINQ